MLSPVVSWATPWDYHCTLLVQGALFSVPDVCVCVFWCHHKCFHLALTGWLECPTPCCYLRPPWYGKVPCFKIWSTQIWQGQCRQNMSGLGHWGTEAQRGGVSAKKGGTLWPTVTDQVSITHSAVLECSLHTSPQCAPGVTSPPPEKLRYSVDM